MMDESTDRVDRQVAEQQWRELPTEVRESFREAASHVMAKNPEFLRAPYEEIALPEVVDEIWIRWLTRRQAEARARVDEHLTNEDVTRLMIEAWNLLPDDASEDMVMDKVMELVRLERPEVFGFHRRQA
jgi:hypothetical protein